jgi:hypothetical protein
VSNAVVYAVPGCPYLAMITSLLRSNGVQFSENIVGVDVVREDFSALFPGAGNSTVVILDGVKIGNYAALREHFSNRPDLLLG